ncbi:MAG TPA: tetratricopeptide repeat protein [Pyrinomonadaceae bacterium]|nr:tetratricopeptide repeat protein [Pyrinomonadaceae bacterium]
MARDSIGNANSAQPLRLSRNAAGVRLRRYILLDGRVWFILRAAMMLRFKLLLLSVAAIVVCGPANEALSQRLPKATGREPENKSSSSRREHRPRIRSTTPATSKSPSAIESNNFLLLGDKFREQKKWKTAEAAYKEAVTVWPGNADALLELGYLYLDRNRIDEAEQTHGKLRSVNASYASNLLAEINRSKNALAH